MKASMKPKDKKSLIMSTKENKFSLLYTTGDSEDNLKQIAHKLVEQGLIACANIFAQGKSIYKWQDKVEESNEHFMLMKTKTNNFNAIEKTIAELHNYDCPALLEIDIKQSSKVFGEFLEQTISE